MPSVQEYYNSISHKPLDKIIGSFRERRKECVMDVREFDKLLSRDIGVKHVYIHPDAFMATMEPTAEGNRPLSYTFNAILDTEKRRRQEQQRHPPTSRRSSMRTFLRLQRSAADIYDRIASRHNQTKSPEIRMIYADMAVALHRFGVEIAPADGVVDCYNLPTPILALTRFYHYDFIRDFARTMRLPELADTEERIRKIVDTLESGKDPQMIKYIHNQEETQGRRRTLIFAQGEWAACVKRLHVALTIFQQEIRRRASRHSASSMRPLISQRRRSARSLISTLKQPLIVRDVILHLHRSAGHGDVVSVQQADKMIQKMLRDNTIAEPTPNDLICAVAGLYGSPLMRSMKQIQKHVQNDPQFPSKNLLLACVSGYMNASDTETRKVYMDLLYSYLKKASEHIKIGLYDKLLTHIINEDMYDILQDLGHNMSAPDLKLMNERVKKIHDKLKPIQQATKPSQLQMRYSKQRSSSSQS